MPDKLTVGQDSIWSQCQRLGDERAPSWMVVTLRIPVPGSGADDAHRNAKVALAAVINRHEGLRTTISGHSDGGFYQLINSVGKEDLPLTLVPDSEFEKSCFSVAEVLAILKFDLTREPPLRAHLVSCGARAVLILVIHHIAADAAALEILRKEFSAVLHGGSFLSPRPLQPRDLAAYEESARGRNHRRKSIDYLRLCAKESPSGLFPDIYAASDRFTMTMFHCPGAHEAARVAADNTRLTKPAIWLAAVVSYLCLRFDAPKCRILSPVSNRIMPGTLGVVANMALNVPLVVSVSGSSDFRFVAKSCLSAIGRGMMNGLSSSHDQWQVNDEAGQRQGRLRDEVYFNYVPELSLADRSFVSTGMKTIDRDASPTFELKILPQDCSILLSVNRSQSPDPEDIARWLESCVIKAAKNPDIVLNQIPKPKS